MASLEKARPCLPARTPVQQKGKPAVASGGSSGKGKPGPSSRQSTSLTSPGSAQAQSPDDTPALRNIPNVKNI